MTRIENIGNSFMFMRRRRAMHILVYASINDKIIIPVRNWNLTRAKRRLDNIFSTWATYRTRLSRVHTPHTGFGTWDNTATREGIGHLSPASLWRVAKQLTSLGSHTTLKRAQHLTIYRVILHVYNCVIIVLYCNVLYWNTITEHFLLHRELKSVALKNFCPDAPWVS